MLDRIIYLYKKKHRYLDPLLQDMIASKTGFKPYKIKLEVASKENPKVKEFNYFEFKYLGASYKLLDKKLTRLT
jgi:hypothetical protein